MWAFVEDEHLREVMLNDELCARLDDFAVENSIDLGTRGLFECLQCDGRGPNWGRCYHCGGHLVPGWWERWQVEAWIQQQQ